MSTSEESRVLPTWVHVLCFILALAAATVAWILALYLRGHVMLAAALLLAGVQAGAVLLGFMDLAVAPVSSRLTMIAAAFLAGLLIFLTGLDPVTRHVPPPEPPSPQRQPAPPAGG